MTEETKKKPELLAPAGSPESLDAALAGGADAVYLGGTLFNARMNAKNFDRDAMRTAVGKCHDAGVKLYVTMNTQLYDRELAGALDYAGFLYGAGVDALITADLGLAALLHEYLPSLPLHASTQMTGQSADAARYFASLGFDRMVCGREMSETEIRKLVDASPIGIEAFVHGAICVSCSGQCMLSAVLGGRSGNRGECAQPCRMSYNGGYPISLRDMCLAGHIPALIDSGVESLKIEGRMKHPSYVYGVTRVYRRLIDERRAADKKDIGELARLFSRGGFTDGYFTGRIGGEMLGVRSEKDVGDSKASHLTIPAEPMKRLPPVTVTERTAPPLPAKIDPREKRKTPKPFFSARFRSPAQIPENTGIDRIYLPLDKYDPARANGVVLPPVIREADLNDVLRRLDRAREQGAEYLMITNMGQLAIAKRFTEEYGMTACGDTRLNCFNSLTGRELVRAGGLKSVLLSPELILPQMRDLTLPEGAVKGVIAYGRLPLMLLEKPVGAPELRDRKNAAFPVLKEGKRDLLVNSVPIYMADQADRLDAAGITERHFFFTTEDRAAVLRVLYAYRHGVIPKEPIRRMK